MGITGATLKKIRLQLRMNQYRFADVIGKSRPSVTNWESLAGEYLLEGAEMSVREFLLKEYRIEIALAEDPEGLKLLERLGALASLTSPTSYVAMPPAPSRNENYSVHNKLKYSEQAETVVSCPWCATSVCVDDIDVKYSCPSCDKEFKVAASGPIRIAREAGLIPPGKHFKWSPKLEEFGRDEFNSLKHPDKNEESATKSTQKPSPTHYTWTSCKFNHAMFKKFSNSNLQTLEIRVEGGTGIKIHPTGTYLIPRAVALDFFRAKQELPCWHNTKEWTCKTIPTDLRDYFTAGITPPLIDGLEAVRLYKLAADQGDASAQLNLGLMYENDLTTARLYELAAHGNAKAQFILGLRYYKGRMGVAQDYQEAARLYKLAAEQGNASAQRSLALMYYKGEGVAQDDQEAARLYKLATDQGDASAQLNLGLMPKNG